MSLSVAAVLFAVVVIGVLPTGSAQVLNPAVSVILVDTPAPLGPGNSTVLNGTVTNDHGQASGTVTLAFTAPAGWTVVLEPASAFTLQAGASAPFTVTLTAPVDAPPADGALGVTATITDQAGRTATSEPATAALVFAPLPPPPVVPWYKTSAGIAGIAFAIALVVGIVVGVVMRRRAKREAAERAAAEAAAHAAYLDRETGITVSVPGAPLQYGHKREIIYRLTVTNKSPRPRVAIVDVAEVTNGWRAAAQFRRMPLSVGESQQVTLVITPDAVITPGDRATVVVRVKPEEARERDERVTIEALAAKHGVPTDAHYRIVTVHREGAGASNRR